MRKALIAIAVFACAAAARPARAQAGRTPTRVRPPGYAEQVTLDTIALPQEISAPFSRVYASAVAVFDELKIPLDTRDSLRGVVGNLDFKRTGNLAGAQMSSWLNCGTGITGPNADSWRIYMSIAALLDRAKVTEQSVLRVVMVAGAQDMKGSAQPPIRCASTGVLEARILEMVKRKAGTP